MRNLLAAFLFLATASLTLAQTTFTAQWFFSEAPFNAAAVKQVYLTPLWTVSISGTQLVIGAQRYLKPTTASSSLTISNLVPGGYRVEYQGPFSTVVFTNSFPTNTSGLVNAGDAQYLSATVAVNGSTVAYSQAAADGRFLHATGDNGGNLTNVNGASVTGAVALATSANNVAPAVTNAWLTIDLNNTNFTLGIGMKGTNFSLTIGNNATNNDTASSNALFNMVGFVKWWNTNVDFVGFGDSLFATTNSVQLNNTLFRAITNQLLSLNMPFRSYTNCAVEGLGFGDFQGANFTNSALYTCSPLVTGRRAVAGGTIGANNINTAADGATLFSNINWIATLCRAVGYERVYIGLITPGCSLLEAQESVRYNCNSRSMSTTNFEAVNLASALANKFDDVVYLDCLHWNANGSYQGAKVWIGKMLGVYTPFFVEQPWFRFSGSNIMANGTAVVTFDGSGNLIVNPIGAGNSIYFGNLRGAHLIAGATMFDVNIANGNTGFGRAADSSASIITSGDIKGAALTFRDDAFENWRDNSDTAGLNFNFVGYNGGAARYRRANFFDGKGSLLFRIDGQLAAITAIGAQTNTSLTATNLTVVNTNGFVIAGVHYFTGVGSPNGAVTGSPGDQYNRVEGGASTSFYVKESGTNTSSGWVGK